MEEKKKVINETFNSNFKAFKQKNSSSDQLFYELYDLRAAQNICPELL